MNDNQTLRHIIDSIESYGGEIMAMYGGSSGACLCVIFKDGLKKPTKNVIQLFQEKGDTLLPSSGNIGAIITFVHNAQGIKKGEVVTVEDIFALSYWDFNDSESSQIKLMQALGNKLRYGITGEDYQAG